MDSITELYPGYTEDILLPSVSQMYEECHECSSVHVGAQVCMRTWQETKPPGKKGRCTFMYTNVKMSRHVILLIGHEVCGWILAGLQDHTRKVLTPGSGGKR